MGVWSSSGGICRVRVDRELDTEMEERSATDQRTHSIDWKDYIS